MAARRHDIDKGLAGVAFLEQRLKVDLARDPSIQGRVDTANERSEMRREYEPDFAPRCLREPLADLRPVAMPRHVVRHEIIRGLRKAEVQVSLAPGAANAGLGVEIGRASCRERV